MPFLIIGALVAILVVWAISVQRKLVVMDENINNAMSQIGVQLSSRFDALTALLDLTKGYAAHESQTLIETVKSRRSVITATYHVDGRLVGKLGVIGPTRMKYDEVTSVVEYLTDNISKAFMLTEGDDDDRE